MPTRQLLLSAFGVLAFSALLVGTGGTDPETEPTEEFTCNAGSVCVEYRGPQSRISELRSQCAHGPQSGRTCPGNTVMCCIHTNGDLTSWTREYHDGDIDPFFSSCVSTSGREC